MKIIEDTDDRLIVVCPRGYTVDITAVILTAIGLVCFAIAATLDPGTMVTVMFGFCLVFVGIGQLLFWTHTSAKVTLDAASQCATIRWRLPRGTKQVQVALTDIASVDVRTFDEVDSAIKRTIQVTLADGQKVLLEESYTRSSPEALPIVDAIRAWLLKNTIASP